MTVALAERTRRSPEVDLYDDLFDTSPHGFAAHDTNFYRYVGNAPTNRTDPSGLVSIPGNEYGDWAATQTNYDFGGITDKNGNKLYGSKMLIAFKPRSKCVADEIAFVQIARVVGINGVGYAEGRNYVKNRMTKDGWAVDRLPDNDSGWYGFNNDGTVTASSVQIGMMGADGSSTLAVLNDTPRSETFNLRYEFETYAICKSGKDKGKVYAGLSWGFEADGNGKVTSLETKNINSPSQAFLDSIGTVQSESQPIDRSKCAAFDKTLQLAAD
jgi:hypothetical protein